MAGQPKSVHGQMFGDNKACQINASIRLTLNIKSCCSRRGSKMSSSLPGRPRQQIGEGKKVTQNLIVLIFLSSVHTLTVNINNGKMRPCVESSIVCTSKD